MKEFQLLRYLSKGKLIIFIVALLGAVGVYSYANSQQVYTATTVIRYANHAISEGLTPNGEELDVSEIYSSTVIKGAIEDLGLNCSVDEVRSKVKVTPIIPEEEAEKKETAISKGEPYEFFPTDYVISYSADSEKSMNYAGNMLDAIIENYYLFYSEKYVDQLILPNNASNISSNDYDYIESAEVIRQSVKDIDDFLIQKKGNYPDFRASSTGYSFSDLESIYNYLINNKVPHLYASILQNKYTKDNDLLLKKQQKIIEDYEISIKNNNQKAVKLKALIDNYSDKSINHKERAITDDSSQEDDRDSIIMDVDGYDREIDVTTTYDDLIQAYVQINQSIKYDQIEKNHNEYIRSVFVDNERNQILSSEVEEEINELVKILNDEYAIVQATAKELNEFIGADYLNILNSVVTSQKVNIKMYIALAVVFFLFFGCAGAIVVGRFKDFIEYIIYTDKVTKLPNRQMCDVRVNAFSEKELEEQFTCVIINIDNLKDINDALGRASGDIIMRDFGEMIKTLSRNYGFIGFNNGGSFMGLFEKCTTVKAELFVDMLSKSVKDYNEKRTDLQIEYSIAYSNSTEDKVYDIRDLIRDTFGKLK